MGLRWKYKDGYISSESPPLELYGFVYELTLKDGKKYIGKRAFWSKTKKQLTKREVEAMENKRLKKWKYIVKESKWRSYTSSSKVFGSRDVVEKRIIRLCKDKISLTYWEMAEMIKQEVLFDDNYLNENLLGKFYKGKVSNG